MKKQILLILIGIIISLGLMLSSILADDLMIQAQELLEKYSKAPPPELNDPNDWNEIMQSKQAGPMVNCIPHYYSWVGREITIWGNVHWGDISSGNYEWDLGDGNILTGVVADARYIAVTHTYTTGGIKTVTLTVTDDNSQIDVDQATIDVMPIVNQAQQVNAAIEDGLRWLYLNQNSNGYWYTTGEYGVGTTGLAVLAFEENAHYGNNDPDEDIYAETVQLGLDWLLNVNGRTVTIGVQTAGDPDTDGDGIGVYFLNSSHDNYSSGIACLAVALSNQPDSVVASGYLAGMTYYEVMEDAMNCIAWSQTDASSGNYRGGWRYSVHTSNNYGSSDNSAVQWPVLALVAIEQNMNIEAPSWVADELAMWLDYSQDINGGFGYTSPTQYLNIAKTGSGIGSHYYIGTPDTSISIQNALNFLDIHWNDTYDPYPWREILNGNFYGLYGLKKAMEFYDITTFGAGPRDWYEEISDYLLNNLNYGQNNDGSWPGSGVFFTFQEGTTATSVLVLTRGVVQLQPIAVISSSNLPQPTNTPIAYSGADSYHQNPEEFITQWEWDFDASDGLDWNNPDAIGEFVTWEYSIEDTFEVTLRVTGSDSLTDTDVHFTIVNDSVNHAPIADPGGPYAGEVGETITLDGSGSYDPDGGEIILYEWDTNGDGLYDDATGETTDVLFDNVYSGLIGLRVHTANACSDSTAPKYVTLWTSNVDLELTENNVTVSNLHPDAGESVTFEAIIECHTEGGASVGEFVVRFYDGDPTIIVNPIETFTLGPMGDGDEETVILNWTMPDTLTHYIYIRADAEDDIEEYNEDNNEVIVELGLVEPFDEPYFCPNPYNPVDGSGIIYPNFDDPITKLRIFDIAGELVKEVENDDIEPKWDGKNEYGDYVANGVYFIIVENQAGEKKIIKVAILR